MRSCPSDISSAFCLLRLTDVIHIHGFGVALCSFGAEEEVYEEPDVSITARIAAVFDSRASIKCCCYFRIGH